MASIDSTRDCCERPCETQDMGFVEVISDIDGELLMELLDDQPDHEVSSSATEVQALQYGEGGFLMLETVHPHEGCEDCGLDHILSDLDQTHDCSRFPAYLIDGQFGWPEIGAAAAGTAESDEWLYVGHCMDECEMVEYYGDSSLYDSLHCCYGDNTEQVYGALWD